MSAKIGLKKFDEEKQIVFGEVYAPDFPDSHGDFMTADEIEKMAYNFVKDGKLDQIDVKHDNKLYNCHVVETFIARKDDIDFIPESWVVGVHVPDATLWGLIKTGELNGFSMEVLALKKEVEIELTLPVVLNGTTDEAEDKEGNLHSHHFVVFIDAEGNFRGGSTDLSHGHMHQIVRGTATEDTRGHTHRFSFVEGILEINDNE